MNYNHSLNYLNWFIIDQKKEARFYKNNHIAQFHVEDEEMIL